MHRIDGANHVSNLFDGGDPAVQQDGTELTADWLNDIQENLAAFIESMGITLIKNDFNQLTNAIIAFGNQFGLAADGVGRLATDQAALDALTVPGMFYTNAGPEGGRALGIHLSSADTTERAQIALEIASQRVHVRTFADPTWGAWRKLGEGEWSIVWNGPSAAAVPMASLSEGGPGRYMVTDGSDWLFIDVPDYVGLGMTGRVVGTSLSYTGGLTAGDVETLSAFFNATNATFDIEKLTFDNVAGTYSEVAVNLTAIYKLKNY